ncbi:MAG: hypothetical protein R3B49_05475 [Phycisphaerales bacterium]
MSSLSTRAVSRAMARAAAAEASAAAAGRLTLQTMEEVEREEGERALPTIQTATVEPRDEVEHGVARRCCRRSDRRRGRRSPPGPRGGRARDGVVERHRKGKPEKGGSVEPADADDVDGERGGDQHDHDDEEPGVSVEADAFADEQREHGATHGAGGREQGLGGVVRHLESPRRRGSL